MSTAAPSPRSYRELVSQFEETVTTALQAEAHDRGLRLERGANTEARRRAFGEKPPLALIGFDTPGIQDYVFGARRPIDIRGGSKIVAAFTPDDSQERSQHSLYRRLAAADLRVAPDAVIYAGGGGGMLLVPAHKAAGLQPAIERLLADLTDGALASVAAVLPVWPDDLSDQPAEMDLPVALAGVLGDVKPVTRYAAACAALLSRLSRRRSERTRLEAPIAAVDQKRRCDVCERRVGDAGIGPDGKETHVCAACEKRREVGRRAGRVADEARSYEDVVAETGSNALALLYADGANFGAQFQAVGSMAWHRALSQAVDSAFRDAREKARSLVRGRLGGDDDDVRFQTAISGGDDLVLIVPAVMAMDVAAALMQTVESSLDHAFGTTLAEVVGDQDSRTRENLARMGVGIGVAIADHHFPVHFLFRYANELLTSAKRCIHDGNARSAVDFLCMASGTPISASIAEVRKVHWRREARGAEPELRLTRRPYTRAGFIAFLENARRLADPAIVPPAQVYAVRAEVLRGHAQSRSFWRYQHARSSDDSPGWSKYRGHTPIGDVDKLLWTQVDGSVTGEGLVYETDFLDAVEVLDLLHANGRRA